MKGMKGTGMIKNGSLVTLASALVLALAFGPALAKVINVPADEDTIQDAVDAAASGDTVSVKKGKGGGLNGEYHESVDIDKKITLKCNGAVIDGAIPGNADSDTDAVNVGGPGIEVMSDGDGSKIIGCTVQEFDDHGILVDADDVTIRRNILTNNNGDGLHLSGDNFLVEHNRSSLESDSDGFEINGDDGTVRHNVAITNDSVGFRMEDSGNERLFIYHNRAFGSGFDPGFRIQGESHTITNNTAEKNNGGSGNPEGHGFEFGGFFKKSLVEGNLARGNNNDGFHGECSDVDENTFRRNVALHNGESGFDFSCDADDNVFTNNKAIGNDQRGFRIRGDDNELTSNRAILNKTHGFEINCNDDGGTGDTAEVCGGPIIGNRAIRNADEHGFELDDLNKTTISRNTSIGNEEKGFDMHNSRNLLIEHNLARDNGEHGFEQSGSGSTNTYMNNRSIGNGRDGFRIASTPDDLTMIKNRAEKNNGDGIDIDSDADDVFLEANRVIRNRGTGIETDAGSSAVLTDNIMKGNRTDLAGKGDTSDPTCGAAVAATDNAGNVLTTGGFGVCTPGTGDE